MIPLHTMAGPLPFPTHGRRGNMPPPPLADEGIPSNEPRARGGPGLLVPGSSPGYAPPHPTSSSASSSRPLKMDDEKSSSSSPNEAGSSLTAVDTSSTGQTRTKRLRPYASKTCSECRRRKIACVPSDAAPDVCRRCHRMHLVCTLAEEVARGDKKRRRRKNADASASGTHTSGESARSGHGAGQNDDDENDEDDDDGEDSAEESAGVNSNFGSADFYHQPNPSTPLGPPAYYPDPRYPMAGPSTSSPYAYPPPGLPSQRTPPSARTPPAFSRSLSLSAPSQRQARPQVRSSIAAPSLATSGPPARELPAPPRSAKPPSLSSSGASSSAKSARGAAATAESKRKAEEGPDTDFIYSIKEEKDLPTSHLRSGSDDHSAQAGGNARSLPTGNPANQGTNQGSEGDSHRAGRQVASQMSSGSAGTVATTQASSSLQAQRALVKAAEDAMSAQSAMLVHGCPVWVYSDLMARFRLLEGLVSAKAKSVSAKISVAGLNAKLADIAADVVDSMDEILEESRLTMPHLPLLRNLISRQEQQHDPGRFLLSILLVFIASNGGTPGHVPHLPRQLLIEIKAFLAHQALDIIMISPTKSRELIIAIEVLAVYDPLLGHSMSSRPQTSWFVVPSSFYLELAVGYAYRLGIVESVSKLQRWCQERKSAEEGEEKQNKDAAATSPLPPNISNLLLDASIWVSLELHTAELCRNLQGVTNCFARDWKPLWPGAVEGDPRLPTMAEVVRSCSIHLANSQQPQSREEAKPAPTDKAASPSRRSPPSDFPTLGSKLGLVNLAFRQDGLILVQEILKTLYDSIPSVSAIDSNYVRLEKDLGNRLKDYADVSHQKIIKSSDACEAETKLITLSGQIFERELAWMNHFYGGYCFAILLWVPKLKKKPADSENDGMPSADVAAAAADAAKQTAITAAKSTANEIPAAAAKVAKLQKSGTGTPSTADDASDTKSTTKEERDSDNEAVGRSIHEHGIHGSDIAKSVIDAIKSQHSNPDAMTSSGRAAEDNASQEEASGSQNDSRENPAATQSDFNSLASAMKMNAQQSPLGPAASGFANASSPTSTMAHKPMSSFDFLLKHTPGHEQGVIRWLTLSLSTTSSLRSGNIHRIRTNSRTIYVCKEIIENHATRKRGWGKVGDEAVIHIGLLKQACDHFKDGDNVLDRSLAKLTKILEKILDGWRKVNKAEPDVKGTLPQQNPPQEQADSGNSTGPSGGLSSNQTATSSLVAPSSRLVGGHTRSHSRKLSSSNLRSTSTGEESDLHRQDPSNQAGQGMQHGMGGNQFTSEQPPWHNQQQQPPMQYTGYGAFAGQAPHQPSYPSDGDTYSQSSGYPTGEYQRNPTMSSLAGDPRLGQQHQQSPGGPTYHALNGPPGSNAGGMNRQTAPAGSYQQPQQPHSAPPHSEWAMQQQQQFQAPPPQQGFSSGNQSFAGGPPLSAGWQSQDHSVGQQSHDASQYMTDPNNQLQAPLPANSINTPGSTTNSLSNFDLGLTNLLDMDIFSTDLDNDWTLNDSLVGAGGSNPSAQSTDGNGGFQNSNNGSNGNALDVESLFMNYWPRLDWGLDGSGSGANGGAGDGMMTAAADMGSELFMAMGGGANNGGDGKTEGPNAGWLSNAQ